MLRKGLNFIALILLVVVVVVVFRTIQFVPTESNVEKQLVKTSDPSAAVERLSQAIQIPTISWSAEAATEVEAFNRLNQHFEQSFPAVYANLSVSKVLEHGRLIEWRGTDPNLEPLLLLAHTDVVPVADLAAWSVEPFSGEIKDGYLYGRGTIDDKSSALAILEAAERLVVEGFSPQRSIFISLGHDEEIGGLAAQEVAKKFADQGVRFASVVDEGGLVISNAMPGIEAPLAMVGIAEKGYLTLKLTSTGEGGHSSMPPKTSAVGTLATALSNIESNPFPAKLDSPTSDIFDTVAPHFPLLERTLFANTWLTEPLLIGALEDQKATNALIRTTTAVTVFHGGTKDNVLPPNATAMVNFRILPGESKDSVTKRVTQLVDNPEISIEKSQFGNEPSSISDPNASAFAWMSRNVAKSLEGEVIVSPNLVSGATDARHFDHLSDNVYRFLPFRVDKADLSRFHGVDERISIDSYIEGIGFYYNLLKDSGNI
jgi:carboxypeptidase PM20D1